MYFDYPKAALLSLSTEAVSVRPERASQASTAAGRRLPAAVCASQQAERLSLTVYECLRPPPLSAAAPGLESLEDAAAGHLNFSEGQPPRAAAAAAQLG